MNRNQWRRVLLVRKKLVNEFVGEFWRKLKDEALAMVDGDRETEKARNR